MANPAKTGKIKKVKILLVVHYYLPRHQAGTEIYTRHLARALAREHEVRIFTSEDGVFPDRRFAVTDDEHEGIPVRRLVHPGPPDFLRSYSDPEFDAEFGKTLDQFRPDLVHFLHLFRLSLGFPAEEARRVGSGCREGIGPSGRREIVQEPLGVDAVATGSARTQDNADGYEHGNQQ